MGIKQYFQIVAKRLWIVVLIPIFTGLAMYFISFYLLVPVFESNTTLYVTNRKTDLQPILTYNDILAGQYLVKDYREIIKSRLVTGAVISELKLSNFTSERLASMIAVSSKNETRVIEIKVQDRDPVRARDIADKLGEVFKCKVIELMKVENISIIDRAEIASNPIRPNHALNISIAVLIALTAATGIVFFIEYLDDTIKTSEDVDKYLGITVLGTIPVLNMK